ncbi:PucR family transcriptional regulator [Nocardioides marmoriginsengisoli]|uniref:PucR family transcriptional regulator n=1 Tax=Nocardioides marmoriginsengisoli TaxID=661483 RepID=A0A3N0CH36_9ACTN|nr:helix-turn-helix domain-containing protein [Nocardioides marmoriginsengisoli]RNL62336.1 PucR family transcriptional regulator [Nocardioides marmoriginsengisoli]
MTESEEERAAALAAWVSAYVAETSREDNVDAFTAQVNASILAEVPEVAADPVLVTEMYASTKAQFQVFLSLLERERQELLLPPQAVDLALSIARRQLELGVLLKIYRVAAGAVWEFFTTVAADVPEDGPDRSDVLIYLWGHGGTWINEAIEQLIGVFYEEREATMHGALARRTETVYALLRGDKIGLDAASTDLGHPLRGLQTALVLWIEEGTSADALAPLNELATSLAGAVKAGRPLTIPVGRREVWTWLATREAPDPVVIAAAVAAQSGSVRVAIGISAPGLAGFRQSHREAVDAQRFAVSARTSAPVTAYADVELACLVAGNEAGITALIGRELGGLAGDERGLDRVRDTVSTYLRFGGSVDQTATSLIVHKNTIRYRLAQAEELIGHPLTERRTEIALALRCLDRYGGVVPG